MPKFRPILQGYIKFRDGKKWRKKYCVIAQSPYNDALHLYCFKNYDEFAPYSNPANILLNKDLESYEQTSSLSTISKSGKVQITPYPLAHEAVQRAVKQTRDGLSLANKIANAISAPGPIDEISGIERGLHLDNKSNVLLLIGINNTYAISLPNEEDMFEWADVMNKRLTDCHFHVTLMQTTGKHKLSTGLQAILHVQKWRICLISEPSAGSRFLCNWRLDFIESIQTIEATPGTNFGQLKIEANASAEMIKGDHKFQVDANKLPQLTEAIGALRNRRFFSVINEPEDNLGKSAPDLPESIISSSFDYASSSDASMHGSSYRKIICNKPPAPPPSHFSSSSRNCTSNFDSGIADVHNNTRLVSGYNEQGVNSAFLVWQWKNKKSPKEKTFHVSPAENSTQNQSSIQILGSPNASNYDSVHNRIKKPERVSHHFSSSTGNEFDLFPPDEEEIASQKSSENDLGRRGAVTNKPQPMGKTSIHKRLALLFHRLSINPRSMNNVSDESKTVRPDNSRPISILHSNTSRRSSMTAPPIATTTSTKSKKSKCPYFYATLFKSVKINEAKKGTSFTNPTTQLIPFVLNNRNTIPLGRAESTRHQENEDAQERVPHLIPSFSTQTVNEHRAKSTLSRLIYQPTSLSRRKSNTKFQCNLRRFLSIVTGENSSSDCHENIRDLPLTHMPVYRFNKPHPRWLIKTPFTVLNDSQSSVRLDDSLNRFSVLPHSLENSTPGMFLYCAKNNPSIPEYKSKFRSLSFEVNSLLSSMESHCHKSSITSPNSTSDCCWYDCQGSCWSLCSQPSSEPVGVVSPDTNMNVYLNLFRYNSAECFLSDTGNQMRQKNDPDDLEVIGKSKYSDYCNVVMMQNQKGMIQDLENHTLTEATKLLTRRGPKEDSIPHHTKDVFVTAGKIAGNNHVLPSNSASSVPEELREPRYNYATVDLRPSPSNSAGGSNLTVKIKCNSSSNPQHQQVNAFSSLVTHEGGDYMNGSLQSSSSYKNKGDHPAYVMTTMVNQKEKNSSGISQRFPNHSLSSVLPQPILNYAELVQMNEYNEISQKNRTETETLNRSDLFSTKNVPELTEEIQTFMIENSSSERSSPPLIYTEIDITRTKVMRELNDSGLDSSQKSKGTSMLNRSHVMPKKSIRKSIKQILVKQQNP